MSVTNDGHVKVNRIDRDMMGENNKIGFGVEATDSGHPPRSGITYVYLTVISVNDNTPEYPENERNVSIYLKESEKLYNDIFQSKVNYKL